jgi:hypothetical protein
MYICANMHSFPLQVLYTVFDAYPNYMQIKMFVKTTSKLFERKMGGGGSKKK